MAPNVAQSWNPITGIAPIPDSTAVNAAVKKEEADVPGLGGVAAIGDFFSRLSEPNTWLRVAEVLIGGVLIIVSLRAMFPGAASAAGDAVKVGAVAA